MRMRVIEGFEHRPTHHCVTGSMLDVYAFHGCAISEDMLLGLGEGVGAGYFRFKGVAPFFGGRGEPEGGSVALACARTGVGVRARKSGSDAAAEKALLASLAAGEPMMLQVDMGFLPYFDFGGEAYHFGGHAVVAVGFDAADGTVTIADRDEEMHAVPLAALRQARASKFRPFPPGRAYWQFDFDGFRSPTRDEVRAAIANQARAMLSPPIKNLGVAGIRKAASEIPRWPALADGWGVPEALFNLYVFLTEVGGSGGGCFRFMLARFLREAHAMGCGDDLGEVAEAFHAIADAWDQIGSACLAASESDAPEDALAHVGAAFAAVAKREDVVWRAAMAAAG
jgi:hypothetical protein